MTSGTLTGAGLSLGAAAVWGGGDFAGGIATKRAEVFRVVAGAHACGLLLMLLLVWITGEPLPPASTLWWGVVAGVTGAFGIAALYQALAIGRMGIVAPVASVITAVLPVLVGMYSEGMPDRIQLVGFVVALFSIWLIARPDGAIDTHRGLGLAVVAGLMFGLFLIAGKHAGHHGVFWPLVAARTASTFLMLVIVAFSAARHPPATTSFRSDSVLRGIGYFCECAFHCSHATRTARRHCGIVVALSRQHGDPGADIFEGAHVSHAECGYCRGTHFRGVDCGALS